MIILPLQPRLVTNVMMGKRKKIRKHGLAGCMMMMIDDNDGNNDRDDDDVKRQG